MSLLKHLSGLVLYIRDIVRKSPELSACVKMFQSFLKAEKNVLKQWSFHLYALTHCA